MRYFSPSATRNPSPDVSPKNVPIFYVSILTTQRVHCVARPFSNLQFLLIFLSNLLSPVHNTAISYDVSYFSERF